MLTPTITFTENSWSFWSQWSKCEPECSGMQNRTRRCFNGNRPRV